jgi:hypothetical protein
MTRALELETRPACIGSLLRAEERVPDFSPSEPQALSLRELRQGGHSQIVPKQVRPRRPPASASTVYTDAYEDDVESG